MTANAIAGAKEYYLKEGFADFFTKPIDGAKLEQMIAAYLPEDLVYIKDAKAEQSGKASASAEKNSNVDYSRYQKYGISIEKGLSNVAGNKQLYLKVVEMFIRDKEKQVQLQQFITDGNACDYCRYVRTLEEDARVLGASNLVNVAFEHEKKSRADNIAYVREHWDELAECWERAREGFAEFCRESSR